MFLKRLEIVGFKSFAERMTIDFVNGVTAVVGPNGSGKSNITDAIRWVLGEQSAKSLRGGKMEDIIFAGSDSRKPLNFAEVSITFNNEDSFLPIDYNEVNITRRVYRSGDSEFYINKQSCRLKDIIDLFMDSGLGREAFSIISQGKVEEILNSKAEDRRMIFEEAAGVLKYKTRKKKAEVKLFETEDNLNRVRDILHELEDRIEPLKMQASIAEDYLVKKEELKNFEVSILVHDIEELHQKWQAHKADLEKHQHTELELQGEINIKEAEIHHIREEMTVLDESVEELQNVLLITSEELKKLEGKQDVLKERTKNAVQNKAQLEKMIQEGKEKLTTMAGEMERLKGLHKEMKLALEKDRKALKSKEGELLSFAEDIEEKIESLKSDYIEMLNEEATIKNDQLHINQQLEQLVFKRNKLNSENEKYLLERTNIEQAKAEYVKQLEELQGNIDKKIGQYLSFKKSYEALTKEYSKLEKNLYQALQFLQQTKSRKEILEEMEEDYTGFYQGVKEVLKSRKQLRGIEGAVAELLKVDKQYEVAIEIALSSSQQHIVVENEAAAREAIQFLKSKSAGRATFLPLNVIKPREMPKHLQESLKTHPDFTGIAVDLIKFEAKYSNIFKNLLGNVVISQNIEGANRLAKHLNYAYRIVTLDGDVVNPGGAMTGGSIKQKNSSILTRKTELETISAKIHDMETTCDQLQKAVKAKKLEIDQLELQMKAIQDEGDSLRNEETILKDQLKELEWNEKNINDRLKIYDADYREFNEDELKFKEKRTLNEKRLASLKSSIEEIDKQIEALANKKQADHSVKEVLMLEINELKISVAKKEEQYIHVKGQLEDIISRYEELLNNTRENEEELELLIQEMNSSNSGGTLIEEQLEQKVADRNKTIELISERRNTRVQLQTKLEDLIVETTELKRQHKGLSELLIDEEVQLNRLDVDLENRLQTLREEYLLTFEAAKENYPLQQPIEEAKKQAKLIKLAIEELGTVNLGAIEEYEKVSERYQFLIEQKADLEQAKDTLYDVIDEMDEEMVKRFGETFHNIRDQFSHVFSQLFGGGRAELRLTNPDDLLNTGVEIVAQPPGKKLQNLGLLSGGERALTAIALLFSILKVRPVPFAVLDEVEAALDEANVYRFSQYLKQFSNETQFIVITHRKGTMEEADVLYGVTMQESGVSKLVSVRLEDDEAILVSS